MAFVRHPDLPNFCKKSPSADSPPIDESGQPGKLFNGKWGLEGLFEAQVMPNQVDETCS
jgi:hypothetical protein